MILGIDDKEISQAVSISKNNEIQLPILFDFGIIKADTKNLYIKNYPINWIIVGSIFIGTGLLFYLLKRRKK